MRAAGAHAAARVYYPPTSPRRSHPADAPERQRASVDAPGGTMKQADRERHWTQELTRVLDGAGLPWRATSCWCSADGHGCGAELTNTRNGASRQIQLSLATFDTPLARRHEVLRQLEPTLRQ